MMRMRWRSGGREEKKNTQSQQMTKNVTLLTGVNGGPNQHQNKKSSSRGSLVQAGKKEQLVTICEK